MKYLRTFENIDYDDILSELELWDMAGYYNKEYNSLKLYFDFPDRVYIDEMNTVNKILQKIKPEKLIITKQKLQGDAIKYLKINKELKYLYCNANEINILPELTDNLEHLDCSENELKELPKLPENIKTLYCFKNKLKYLPTLPESLRDLDCSYNNLKELPKLPENIEDISCEMNRLQKLPKLPEKIKNFHCFEDERVETNSHSLKAFNF